MSSLTPASYSDQPYFHTATARDLTGRDRLLYRALEIFPGALSWATLLLCIVLSFFVPIFVACFIIAFDIYWLVKNVYLSAHLRHNWKRLKHNMTVDWSKELSGHSYGHVYHMVVLPFYKEPADVVRGSLNGLLASDYDHSKLIVVLAGEGRAEEHARAIEQAMKNEYAGKFGELVLTVHPAGLPNEIPGKGSNISYATETVAKQVVAVRGLRFEDVLVSAFDVDTVPYPQYFNCLTWHFLTTPDRLQCSYQPVPLFNNNLWQAPAISRVMATSSSFWQMIQQERPERLATFSSHAIPLSALAAHKYWQRNMVSEDSRIFFNMFMAHNGNYRVVPISYPVSMDANVAPTLAGTVKNIYKQHLRWMWGVENIPYIVFHSIKNKAIPLRKRVGLCLTQIEGFWSLATNPIIIFLLGWLPLMIGGDAFNDTIIARNLPIIARDIMSVTMLGLILLAAVSQSLLPVRPPQTARYRRVTMILQWILVPITITVFAAIPGLHAQTRLMFGRYMGFWVTPKARSKVQ